MLVPDWPEGLMWAQVLTAPKRLEYMQIAIPRHSPREVLVKLSTAAICNGSDPTIFDGLEAYPTPLVFGHEPFGKIVACGDEVEGFAVGERLSWWFTLGAFAEYVAFDPTKAIVIRVPETIPAEEAPLLELVTASIRAVRPADVNASSGVLILGLGPSGLIMSQRAKILGASRVVGWDLYPMRREKGLRLGCDAVFDPRDGELIERTRGCIGEADVIIDAMGNDALPGEPTLDYALQILKKGGKVVSYGHPTGGRKFSPFLLQGKGAVICPPEQDPRKIQQLMQGCLDDVVKGRLKLGPLVSEVIPLSQVEQGLAKVRDHPEQYLKIIILVEGR